MSIKIPLSILACLLNVKKKSGANSELQLMLLPRNFRVMGHKTQFYLKRDRIFRFSANKKFSNLQIACLFTFIHIKEYGF